MGWSVNHGESWNDVNTVTLEGLDSAVSISSWVHIIDGHCAVLVGAALGSTTSVGVLAEDMNHAWSRVAVPTIGDFDRMGSSIAIASYPVSQAVAVSRDNGADWEFSSLKFDDRVVNVVFFRPRWHLPNSLEAAVSVEMSISPSAHRFAGGLADSSDGGKTWKPILLDGAVSDDVMVGDVDDSGDLALAGHGMAWTAMIVSGSLEPVASVELPGDARPVSISAGSPVLVRTVPGACHDVRSCRVSVSKLDADGRSVALVGSM